MNGTLSDGDKVSFQRRRESTVWFSNVYKRHDGWVKQKALLPRERKLLGDSLPEVSS